jgi:hypothetical protein
MVELILTAVNNLDVIIVRPFIYGASFIPAQFDVTLTAPSAFKFPIMPPDDTTFQLVVRWVDSDGDTHRRKLWALAGVDIAPPLDLYNGETISASFTLECWNVDGASTIELPSELVLYSSLSTLPTTDTDHTNMAAIDNPTVDTTLAAPFPLTPFPLVFNTQQTY